MLERNSLAAIGFMFFSRAASEPSRGGKLNCKRLRVCNWRPDSETVASRDFAQTL